MAILPKPAGTGGGTIRGAASSLVGNVGTQIKGVAARQAPGLNPSNIASQAARTADLSTGGLVSAVQRGLGIKGAIGNTDPLEGTAESRDNQPLNITGLPQWGGLSKHLFARIFPCNAAGVEKLDDKGRATDIFVPATDVQFEATLNWQSPFEQSGPESKAPTIMALLQTGQVATIANQLQDIAAGTPIEGISRTVAGKFESWARELEGRTGITKLNSRQVFAGMPPVRITMNLHLRAFTDADIEVMDPYQRLLEWAFPQKLAANGIISEIISNSEGFIRAMFPSEAPQMVGLTYGNNRYAAMVIESVSNPLDGPMDESGRPLYRTVQIVLATLTALDKNDVASLFTRSS